MPYFKEDETYDRRFYENPRYNYFIIFFALLCIYILFALWYWGNHSLGVPAAEWMGVYNLVAFGATLGFMAWMLIVGAAANKLKREHLFWRE